MSRQALLNLSYMHPLDICTFLLEAIGVAVGLVRSVRALWRKDYSAASTYFGLFVLSAYALLIFVATKYMMLAWQGVP